MVIKVQYQKLIRALMKNIVSPNSGLIMLLSLISGKSAFLHDGYIATIENCYAPAVVDAHYSLQV